MAFKMKGFSGFGNSPMKQNGVKIGRATYGKKAKKDTRTPSQKARDKRDLERQLRIYRAQEKARKYHREREMKELKEKGYYIDAATGKKIEHVEEIIGGKKRKYAREVRD